MNNTMLISIALLNTSILVWFVLGLLYRRKRIGGKTLFAIVLLLLGTITAFGIRPLSWFSFLCGFSLWVMPVYLSLALFKKRKGQ